MDKHITKAVDKIETVLETDKIARATASSFIQLLSRGSDAVATA
jgi:hypothetical protein